MHVKKAVARREGNGSRTPVLWDPFREMRALRGAVSELFDEAFTGSWPRPMLSALEGGRTWSPAVDIEETDKEYILSADLPGMEKGGIRIELEGGMLRVSGRRKEETEHKGKNFLRREQFYGSFSRCFALPEGTKPEGIHATYKEGLLRISVPKTGEFKAKAIPVKVE